MVKKSFEVKSKPPKQHTVLIHAKHPSDWKNHFVLPDKYHYIDSNKVAYLDKGQYQVGDEALQDLKLDDKEQFRLYFKCITAKDKDKFLGDILPSQNSKKKLQASKSPSRSPK